MFTYSFLSLFIQGCVQTISVIGPIFGYLLGSLCAKIYVDFGYVDMGELAVVATTTSKMHNTEHRWRRINKSDRETKFLKPL